MSYAPISSQEPPVYSNEDGERWKTVVQQSEKATRQAFIRKVYGILTAQLAITVLVSCVMYYVEPITLWALRNPWTLWVNFFFSIVLLIGLHLQRRVFPMNFSLLALFTVNISFIVGLSIAISDIRTVLQAAILTLVVFSGLTLFTLQSKWDFSGITPFLFGGLLLLVSTGVVGFFIPFSNGLQMVLAVVGVIIFSGYILCDTYMIMEKLSPEEYIIAAIDLYLDIINLFLQFLQLLAKYNEE